MLPQFAATCGASPRVLVPAASPDLRVFRHSQCLGCAVLDPWRPQGLTCSPEVAEGVALGSHVTVGWVTRHWDGRYCCGTPELCRRHAAFWHVTMAATSRKGVGAHLDFSQHPEEPTARRRAATPKADHAEDLLTSEVGQWEVKESFVVSGGGRMI